MIDRPHLDETAGPGGVLARFREAEWAPVTGGKFLGALALVVLLAMFLSNSDKGFVPILDHVNLAFHEAGHLFFGLFGYWIGFLGGTLGQLLMPALVMCAFWRKDETASFAVATIWLFENLLNIAHYMADARTQQLPLVGGGEHDWANLLLHWNLLQQDLLIAGWLRMLAWMGMIGVLLWLFVRWQKH